MRASFKYVVLAGLTILSTAFGLAALKLISPAAAVAGENRSLPCGAAYEPAGAQGASEENTPRTPSTGTPAEQPSAAPAE